MVPIPLILAGAVYNNTLTICATLLCRACADSPSCVAVRVSDTANMRIHGDAKRVQARRKILCRSPFRSGRRSLVCARLSNKGKAGVQRGRKTAGCPSFLPPRRAPRIPALRRAQLPRWGSANNPRPLGANTLTRFVHPAGSVQRKKAAARKGAAPTCLVCPR